MDGLEELCLAKEALEREFNLEEVRERIRELKPLFDKGEARGHIEEYLRLEHQLGGLGSLFSAIGNAKESTRIALELGDPEYRKEADNEVVTCLNAVKDFLLENRLKGKYDRNNAIIRLHVDQGRDDIGYYLKKFRKAYTYFAEEHGFTVEVVDEGDLRECTIKIAGEKAYGYFRGEEGKHRINYRKNDAKRKGDKDHRGYILVSVVPEINKPKFKFKKGDLRYDSLKSGSVGGTNNDCNSTGVRITHLPTKITSTLRTRSRNINEKTALKVLYSRVDAHYRKLEEEKEQKGKPKYRPSKGDQIRNYNLTGHRYIKDARTSVTTTDIEGFFNGDMGPFIFSYHGIRFNGYGK